VAGELLDRLSIIIIFLSEHRSILTDARNSPATFDCASDSKGQVTGSHFDKAKTEVENIDKV
jgi:hypothetical protein